MPYYMSCTQYLPPITKNQLFPKKKPWISFWAVLYSLFTEECPEDFTALVASTSHCNSVRSTVCRYSTYLSISKHGYIVTPHIEGTIARAV